MEVTTKRNVNHCLNGIKGIACIGVVFTHILFPGKFGSVILTAAASLVPVFFLISGYYVFSTSSQNVMERLPGKMKYISLLTISSCFFYIVWKFIKAYILKMDIGMVIQEFNIKNGIRFLVLNDTSFLNGGHLWFLLALLYCYIALWILVKIGMVEKVYPLILVMFVGRVLVTYTGNWHHSQNFWFYGFPYFFLGYWIREHETCKEKIANKALLVIFIVSLIFSELGYWYSFLPVNIYEIGTICAAISCFFYGIKNGEKGENSWLAQVGKKYSLFVYIVHLIVLESIDIVDSRIWGTLPLGYRWVKPLMVAGITIGLAMIAVKLKERKGRL